MPIAPFVPSRPRALANHPLFNDPSLVSYWKLDGNSNDSKGSYNGTDTNISYVQSYFDQGASFNGTSSKIQVLSDLGITGGVITLRAALKLNSEISSSVYCIAYQFDAGTQTGYKINYEYNGGTRRLYFIRIRQNQAFTGPTHTITLGTSAYYRLTLTYDGTNVRGYVNGDLIGTVSDSGNGSASALVDRFTIGTVEGGAEFANAIIDDVSIFSRALSSEEERSLNGFTKGYYPLQGNSNDYSGNGNNGTDTNITYTPSLCKCFLNANFNSAYTSYITLPNLKLDTGDITIHEVINPKIFVQNRRYYASSNSNGAPYNSLEFNTGASDLRWNHYNGSTDLFVSVPWTSVPLFRDTLFTFTRIGDVGSIYMNGRLMMSNTGWSGRNCGGAYNQKIGLDGGTNSPYTSIRNVIIEGRGWSAPEIAVFARRLNFKFKRQNWWASAIAQVKSNFFMFFMR